jgi:signal transduction histidine kinase
MIVLGIFTFLLNSSLGLFTIIKRKNNEGFVFGLFAIAVSLWVLGLYSTLIEGTLFWGRFAFMGAVLGIGFLLLFSLVFPNNKKISLFKKIIVTVPMISLSVASMTNLMIKDVHVESGTITGTFGPLMLIYQVYAPLYVLLSVSIFISSYRKATDTTQRNQILYALLGLFLFMIPAVITNAILPLWFKIYDLNAFGPVFSMCMIGFIAYAIIRHQFLDIKIIIQRGLIYSILLGIVAGVYLSLVFILEYFFNEFYTSSVLMSAFVTTLIGIFGVPPLKLYFQKITDPIFFKDTYDYASVLRELTDILNQNITTEGIIEKSSAIIASALKAQKVTLHLKSVKMEEQQGATVRIPIRSNKKRIGYLELTGKRSGDPYTTIDINLLETFAKQAAIALEKAALYNQVKEYAKNLEKKVEDRTTEIKNIQKEKETLMSEISHGLQTPLTIMKGELFFLRKQGYDTPRIDTIDASIDRISTFIYRLLSLSRVESGSNTPRTRLDISTMLCDLVSFFTVTAKRENITITDDIVNAVFIEGNKEEIDELISNILSNAIKYMGNKKERHISVSLKKQDGSAHITISDTGIGMKEENLSHLFQTFYRIKDEETKNIKGTGLGLAICKKITDKHGGSIHVTSEYGQGTEFIVDLPLAQEETGKVNNEA